MRDIIAKHRARVVSLGYSEDQSEEIIHRISAILCAFIDAAWGAHPVQLSGGKVKNKGLPSLPDYARIGTKSEQIEQAKSEERTAEERRIR